MSRLSASGVIVYILDNSVILYALSLYSNPDRRDIPVPSVSGRKIYALNSLTDSHQFIVMQHIFIILC